MQRKPGPLAAVVAAAVAALFMLSAQAADSTSGKASAQDVEQQTAEAIDAIKSYSVEQRDKALAEADALMKDLDRRIDALEADLQARSEQMSESARRHTRDTMQALKAQRQELSRTYERLKSSSSGAWGEVKQGFIDSYESLRDAFVRAGREFQDGADDNSQQ
ncbi:MAG: hypothetical protein PVF40_04410 [Ectothiorhodospiraceae bacterium]